MQAELFKPADRIINLPDQSSISEYPGFYSEPVAMQLLNTLILELPWGQENIRIAGKSIPIPRLQCWIGDANLRYSYSGIKLPTNPWSPALLAIKQRVEGLSGHSFNSVLANYYRDGNDSVSWHSDNESELGPNPVIASVSFGAARYFDLKPKLNKDLARVRLTLHNGSLLVMGNTVQNNWVHQIPKMPSLTLPRVNLTFRLIMG